MSNKTDLQAHNADLQSYVNQILNLPTAKNWSGGVLIPSTKQQIVPAYTNQDVIIDGDTDLIPGNILKGKEIFGVMGTLVKGVTGVSCGAITPTKDASAITITHNLGAIPKYFAVIAENLMKGIGTNISLTFCIGLPSTSSTAVFGALRITTGYGSEFTNKTMTLKAPGTIMSTDFGHWVGSEKYFWVAVK